jgi:hypothetical protein
MTEVLGSTERFGGPIGPDWKFGIEGKELVPYAETTRRVPGGLNDCRGLFL